jgi:hypothetical protein
MKAVKQGKKVKPIYFSQYFNIPPEKLTELGCFDPIINFDTKLFVEPLLLKKSGSEIMQNAYKHYHDFFSNCLMLLLSSKDENDKCFKAVRKLLKFPEYKHTCLGYGGDNISGSGSGAELNEKILQSAKEIAEKAKQNPAVLPFLALLEEGIGADRISDMVQNIIDEDICKYTIGIMEKIGLKGEFRYVKNDITYLLPLNFGS